MIPGPAKPPNSASKNCCCTANSKKRQMKSPPSQPPHDRFHQPNPTPLRHRASADCRPRAPTRRPAIPRRQPPPPALPLLEALAKIRPAVKRPLRPADPRQADLALRAWRHLGGGLYRHKSGGLYSRPVINGRRTWRALGTANEKAARQILTHNQVAHAKSKAGAGLSPYAKPQFITAGQVLRKYLEDNCPDRRRRQRTARNFAAVKHQCLALLGFWDTIQMDGITLATCNQYCDWRLERVHRGRPGHCTVDAELCALNSAFTWSVRCEFIRYNPLVHRRAKYHDSKDTQHCREFMPADAAQIHHVARTFFASVKDRSQSVGWQYLLEAFTGVRTEEALRLRLDAPPGRPGHLITDHLTGSWKALEIGRAKSGINPYALMTPHLELLLRNLFAWHAQRHPKNPFYFPSPLRDSRAALHRSALVRVLRRVSLALGRKLTSHGARAYYVTARRSWGVSDVQIAIEIGHRGGPHLLVSTYGGVPTNWLHGDGPKMGWLPETGLPAWSVLNLPTVSTNILQLPKTTAA